MVNPCVQKENDGELEGDGNGMTSLLSLHGCIEAMSVTTRRQATASR